MNDEIKVNSENTPRKNLATLGQVKDALDKRDEKIDSLKEDLAELQDVNFQYTDNLIDVKNENYMHGYGIAYDVGNCLENPPTCVSANSSRITYKIPIKIELGKYYKFAKNDGTPYAIQYLGLFDENGDMIQRLESCRGFSVLTNTSIRTYTNPTYTNHTDVELSKVPKFVMFSTYADSYTNLAQLRSTVGETDTITDYVPYRIASIEENKKNISENKSEIDALRKMFNENIRFVVFSDIHYNQNNASDGDDERMQLLVDSLNAEHQKRPIDFCIFNGDIAIGFDKSSIEAFRKKFAYQFNMPVFWFAGDHDDVFDSTWVDNFGNHRQTTIETEKFYLICADFYNDSNDDGLESSGVRTVSVVDKAWLTSECNKAKALGKKIIILTHYIYNNKWVDIRNVINKFPEVIAVISSHSHNNSFGKLNDNTKLIQTGNFSYPNGADWSKKGENNEHLWGFANFETENGGLYHWYIEPSHNYENIGVNLPHTEREKHLVATIDANDHADIVISNHNNFKILTDAIKDIYMRLDSLSN